MKEKRKQIKPNPNYISKNVGSLLENENGEKISYDELMKEIIKTAQEFYKNKR
jgi:hypothetical protein